MGLWSSLVSVAEIILNSGLLGAPGKYVSFQIIISGVHIADVDISNSGPFGGSNMAKHSLPIALNHLKKEEKKSFSFHWLILPNFREIDTTEAKRLVWGSKQLNSIYRYRIDIILKFHNVG